VAEGKEVREFGGKTYLMERALHADVSLIKAWKADRHGNLVYRKTARNFNPVMATAADFTIAEVEELVEPGELDPEEITTPGIYIDSVVVGPAFKKPIEWRFIKEYGKK
jgi:3-oxoacid CoA-transferase subunit A